MKKNLFLLAFVSMILGTAMAQNNLGYRFWAAIPQNYLNESEYSIRFCISGDTGTRISISQPALNAAIKRSWHGEAKIPASGVFILNVERTDLAPYGHTKSELGVLIRTDKPCHIYVLSNRAYSADATNLLPETALGSQYTILSYKENVGPYSAESQFSVLATEDSTDVWITLSEKAKDEAWRVGVPTRISLDKGEFFQVQGLVSGNTGGSDLTGTIVRAENRITKEPVKIAVFSGNTCTNVSLKNGCGGYCDVLYEQQLPNTFLNKEFIFAPFVNHSSFVVRVLAVQDSTLLYLNGSSQPLVEGGKTIVLDKGSFHNLYLQGGSQYDQGNILRTNKSVFVAQMMHSRTCTGVSENTGDPFMIYNAGISHWLRRATFYAGMIESSSAPPNRRYYAQIIVPIEAIDSVWLDEKLLPRSEFVSIAPPASNGRKYAFSNQSIVKGSHKIRTRYGFNLNYYHTATNESSGYAIWPNIAPVATSYSIRTESDQRIRVNQPICKATLITLGMETPHGYDNTHITVQGKRFNQEQIDYSFDKAGTYPVRMVTYNSVLPSDSLVLNSNVEINPMVKNPDQTITANGTFCAGTPLSFTLNSTLPESEIASYGWEINDDQNWDANTKSINIIEDSTIERTISGFVVSKDGCTFKTSLTYSVVDTSNFKISAVKNVLTAPLADSYQWYMNGKPIEAKDGGNNRILIAPYTGNYQVRISKSPCFDNALSRVFFLDPVNALPADPLASRLLLYPNPASQTLNLGYEGAAAVRILDVLGKEVAAFSFRDAYALNVSGFAKGVYLVEVIAPEGKSIRRVVVE